MTIQQCRQCGRPINDASASSGRCAHCGAELTSKKPGTVADVRIDQTTDFGASSLGDDASAGDKPVAPSTGTVHEAHGLQTADFGLLFGEGKLPNFGTPDSAANAAPPAASSDVTQAPQADEPKTGTVHEAHGLQTADFGQLFGEGKLPDFGAAQPPVAAAPSTPSEESRSDEPKTGTVHEAHGLQTMNFDAMFDAPKPAPSSGPAPGSSSDVGKKTGLNDANIAATYDSGPIGSDLVEQLSMVWGPEVADESEASAQPHVTIKGKEITRTRSDQTLVINSRAVRDNRKLAPTIGGKPPTLADYELLSVLGEGGMGVVYTARQASIDRTVAVKMLKPGMAGNRDLQQKFLAEAVVTGDLDHPNIVPMYDLGKNEGGDLFYAMKRVQGTPWSKVIAAKTQQENVEILLKAADAVAFAHSRGVIHRDLKPENIMLGEFGEVLVMDWGLAYSTAAFRKSASITQTSSMGGSPAYMAPEMAIGPIERITFSSDIYLLGAILYEILTGKPPHSGGNVTKCLMSAARNEILPTDKTGELVDVARKAMATQPADRYPTVAALQAAIRECLAHSESLALVHRAEEELAKAAASADYQNYSRALFGFEEAFALWKENQRAADGVQIARLRYAEAAFGKGDYDLAAGLLDRNLSSHSGLAEQIRRAQAERDARQVRLRRAKQFVAVLGAAVLIIGVVAYFGIRSQRDRALQAEEVARVEETKAREAEKIATVEAANARKAEGIAVVEAANARKAEGEAIEARDVAQMARDAAQEARAAEEYAAYGARIGLAAARIEENAFATASELLDGCPPELRGWEWGRLKFLCDRSKLSLKTAAPLNAVAVDAGASRYAAAGWNGVVDIWSADGKRAAGFKLPAAANSLAFTPDGKSLVVGSDDPKNFVAVVSAVDGKPQQSFVGHMKPVFGVTLDRSGKRLLTASADGTARLWDFASGKELRVLRGHNSAVTSAVLSSDEQTIVTTGADGTAIVWPIASSGESNSAAPSEVRAMLAHKGPVNDAAFAPDGRTVATASADRRILLWRPDDVRPYRLAEVFSNNPPAPPTVRELVGHEGAVLAVAFSADGRRLASCGDDNAVIVWDVASGKLLKKLRGHAGKVRDVRFLDDGRQLVSVGYDQTLKLWDVDAYEEAPALQPIVVAGHADAVLGADFAPDERSLVTAGRDRTAHIVRLDDPKTSQMLAEGHEYLASAVVVSPDGQTLITAAVDGTARVWDRKTGTQRALLPDTGRSAVLTVSDDGTLVATGSSARGVKLWKLADGSLVRTLPPHRTEVSAVAFSPDGALLMTGENSGRINAFRTADGASAWTTLEHSRRITALAFTPDGRQLLSASLDDTVGRWNAADGTELRPLIWKHPGGVLGLARVGADRAVTTCDDGRVRLWKLTSAESPLVLPLPAAEYGTPAASRDGRYVALPQQQTGVLRLFDVADQREVGPHAKADDDAPAPWLDTAKFDALLWSAAFAPDGKSLITVGGDEALQWDFDAASPLERPTQTFRPHGAVAAVAYSPDGRTIATAGWDGSVKLWDAATSKAVRKIAACETGAVNDVVYSRDGRLLLTLGDDGTARIWNADDGSPIVELAAAKKGRLLGGDFDADGRRIVVASADGVARIWNVADRKVLHELAGHDRSVHSARFSRDGRFVATAGADDTARVWNAADGKPVAVLAGHTAPVTSVDVTADGSRVVTGSRDSGVKVWDAAAGKELLSLKGHADAVNVVRFSPSGRTILSADDDGTVILWPTVDWNPKK